MKSFFLFVFITVGITAAPHASASDEHKLHQVILEEIIQSIKEMKGSLTAEIFVQNVITTEHCNRKSFCKAGNILSEYKAEQLGLKEKDWLLPRKLVALTRDIHCKDPASEDRVKLQELLENIHQCAQKEYSKS